MNQIKYINSQWDLSELEQVSACPYCDSNNSKCKFSNVEDWYFNSTSGKWNYWKCLACEALYLNPRPKIDHISKAYKSYYTHGKNSSSKIKLKNIIKNEFLSQKFDVDLLPRLFNMKIPSLFVNLAGHYITIPFGFRELVTLKPGKLLDIGCGNGGMLHYAKQLGWSATGVEFDPKAVLAARSQGLDIIEGDYKILESSTETYDCIICSHVLEHVHSPLNLLAILTKSLSTNGTLLLSCPNANSKVLDVFGDSWRGIEAPRHIAIPSLTWVEKYFKSKNMHAARYAYSKNETFNASFMIFKSRFGILYSTLLRIKIYNIFKKKCDLDKTDYIQLILKK